MNLYFNGKNYRASFEKLEISKLEGTYTSKKKGYKFFSDSDFFYTKARFIISTAACLSEKETEERERAHKKFFLGSPRAKV